MENIGSTSMFLAFADSSNDGALVLMLNSPASEQWQQLTPARKARSSQNAYKHGLSKLQKEMWVLLRVIVEGS